LYREHAGGKTPHHLHREDYGLMSRLSLEMGIV
jgi:hypothetical protein